MSEACCCLRLQRLTFSHIVCNERTKLTGSVEGAKLMHEVYTAPWPLPIMLCAQSTCQVQVHVCRTIGIIGRT